MPDDVTPEDGQSRASGIGTPEVEPEQEEDVLGAAPTEPAAKKRRLRLRRTGNGELWAVGGKGAAPVALRWDAQHGRWARAADPGVVVRGLATVSESGELWIAGIAR